MESVRELNFLVEEKRGAIDVYTAWLSRLAVVIGFLVIGATKFSSGRGEWYRIRARCGIRPGAVDSPMHRRRDLVCGA